MDTEMIKEYLVGLGFKVDDAGVRKFNETLQKLGGLVEQHTSGMMKNYAAAAATIVTSLGSVISSTVALMDTIAQADLGYQKYAMRMYMTRDAAKQLKIVTDAMGESLQDIAWHPELRERYVGLMGEARKLETPRDAESQLRYIRDIRFEFTRLKVEVSYGMQWVGYNLFKHLVDPITRTKIGFKAFNDYIVENIPKWSEKIAIWLSKVVTLTTDALRPLEKLKEMFSDLWKVMTPGEKMLTTLIGVGGLFAIGGPFGRAVVLISGLILLINDFYTHMRGGKSLIGEGWDEFLNVLREIEWHIFRITKIWSAHMGYIKGEPGAPKSVKELNALFGPEGTKKLGEEFLKYESETPARKRPSMPAFYVKPQVGTQAEIYNAAQDVSKKTGIPASLVYGRWYFETGGFTNRGAQELNNLSGIKIPGGKDYRGFKSLSEFANYEASLIQKSYPGAMGAQTSEALTKGLAGGKLGSWAESMMTPEGMAAYTAGTNKGQDIYHIIYDIKAPITIDGSLGNARDIAKEAGQTIFDLRFAAKTGRY